MGRVGLVQTASKRKSLKAPPHLDMLPGSAGLLGLLGLVLCHVCGFPQNLNPKTSSTPQYINPKPSIAPLSVSSVARKKGPSGTVLIRGRRPLSSADASPGDWRAFVLPSIEYIVYSIEHVACSVKDYVFM